MNIQLTIDINIQKSIERELTNIVDMFSPDMALAVVMNPKTGEMGTGVKEVTVGYYPNLEWALHKIKDLNISESDADTVDVLLEELEQIDETIRLVADEVK